MVLLNDYLRYVLNVNSSGGNISCNEYPDLSTFQVFKSLFSVWLFSITMDYITSDSLKTYMSIKNKLRRPIIKKICIYLKINIIDKFMICLFGFEWTRLDQDEWKFVKNSLLTHNFRASNSNKYVIWTFYGFCLGPRVWKHFMEFSYWRRY